MADILEIDPSVPLHAMRLEWTAPTLLTPNGLTDPIDDFARLYRMTTGIFGRGGYRRMDQPFPYARPYLSTVEFGSPLSLEVIVPTVIFGGATAKLGLPKLLDLVKQVLLMKSNIEAERAVNRRKSLEAKLGQMELEELLAKPEAVKRKADLVQQAEIEEAQARTLAAIAEADDVLAHMDKETLNRVAQLYGDKGIKALANVARRAQTGPAKPSHIEVKPVTQGGDYPAPPASLPRPKPILPPSVDENA